MPATRRGRALRPGRALATRGADGTWTAPEAGVRLRPVRRRAHRRRDGRVRVGQRGAHVRARVFDPATRLGDTDPLGTAAPSDVLAVGGDAEGDAVALVSRRGDAGFRLSTFGYDAAGPRVTALALPERGGRGHVGALLGRRLRRVVRAGARRHAGTSATARSRTA